MKAVATKAKTNRLAKKQQRVNPNVKKMAQKPKVPRTKAKGVQSPAVKVSKTKTKVKKLCVVKSRAVKSRVVKVSKKKVINTKGRLSKKVSAVKKGREGYKKPGGQKPHLTLVAMDSSRPLSLEERQKWINEYMPLIRFHAQKISVRLPANIDVEDLVSTGVIGLMDALDKYDPCRDNKFKTYAEFRIRGAILDGLRAQDWVPRSVRDKAKLLERTHASMTADLGRAPTDKEAADQLGLTLKEYFNLLNTVQPINMLSIDEAGAFNNMDRKSFVHLLQGDSDPFSHLDQKSVQTGIKRLIDGLPERQRMVLTLYYYEGFNLRKIGSILEVTESRVSQLHAQAIQRLKVKLKQHFRRHELKVA